MSLASVTQTTRSPGGTISLFRFDTTPVGGSVLFFATGAEATSGLHFGGVYYTPVDVEFTDFEVNGNGSLPQPKMRISNTNSVIQDMINSHGDLVGCELRRIRTFDRFLDGQPEADPSFFYGPDVFLVERKTHEDPIYVEWELSAAIDQDGRMLPGRALIRDTCSKRYRAWSSITNTFVYPAVNPCPYTGEACFTALGDPTDSASDACGRKVSDCKKRFGVDAILPFGGFPGAARVRL